MQLTQIQLDLIKRQIFYDSTSLSKQLAIAQTQLSVQMQENKNQTLIAKEKLRRTLMEMSKWPAKRAGTRQIKMQMKVWLNVFICLRFNERID